MSEELGEVIVDKETARASYVLLTVYLFLFLLIDISFGRTSIMASWDGQRMD